MKSLKSALILSAFGAIAGLNVILPTFIYEFTGGEPRPYLVSHAWPFLMLALLALAASCNLIARDTNPSLPELSFHWTSMTDYPWIRVAASGLLVAAIVWVGSPMGLDAGFGTASGGFVALTLGAAAWLVLFFRNSKSNEWTLRLRTAGFGAAFGVAVYAAVLVSGRLLLFLTKFCILIFLEREPRDSSVICLCSLLFSILGGLTFPAAASFAASLSADGASWQERLRRAGLGLAPGSQKKENWDL